MNKKETNNDTYTGLGIFAADDEFHAHDLSFYSNLTIPDIDGAQEPSANAEA